MIIAVGVAIAILCSIVWVITRVMKRIVEIDTAVSVTNMATRLRIARLEGRIGKLEVDKDDDIGEPLTARQIIEALAALREATQSEYATVTDIEVKNVKRGK
jgi:hypothetical protein